MWARFWSINNTRRHKPALTSIPSPPSCLRDHLSTYTPLLYIYTPAALVAAAASPPPTDKVSRHSPSSLYLCRGRWYRADKRSRAAGRAGRSGRGRRLAGPGVAPTNAGQIDKSDNWPGQIHSSQNPSS